MLDKIKSLFKNGKFISFLLCLPFICVVIFVTWPLPAIILIDPIISLISFIGLFGTVWGVMDSFASIGVNQSVSIGVIAPGLAVALGTTALGLIAAVPAAIAHQYFAKRADDLYERLDDTRREMQSKNKDKK